MLALSTAVERDIPAHPELSRKPSRKLRKNYKTTVLPPGRARGLDSAREAFRGAGSPMLPAHGKRVKSFVRGDRIFTGDDAIWLRAGHGDQHVVSGTGGRIAYNRDLFKLSGAQLRALVGHGGDKGVEAQREIERRKANRKTKKGA